MSRITYVTRHALPDAADRSQITDLEIIRAGGQDRLVATTRYDGVISSWDISGGGLSVLDTADHLGGLRPGGAGMLATLTVNGTTTVLTGGAANGGLRTVTTDAAGGLGVSGAVSNTAGVIGGLKGTTTLTLANGQQVVYGGVAGQDGLGRLRFDSDGVSLGGALRGDTAQDYAADIADTTHLLTGGQRYVYSVSATEHGVQSWVVGGTGGISAGPGLGINEGLWITTPTVIETARAGGQDFLIVGAATSGSLSVIRVATDGSLHVTDHVLDTRDTRFDGVAALDVITLNGQTYVVSGGADDGVNLHQLLPGGQLAQIDAFADTPAAGLTNISAITTRAEGNTLQIYVASATEDGITRLAYNTGNGGQTLTAPAAGGTVTGGGGRDVLTGRAGDDVLQGGGGNDILRDGAGVDTLTGGAGADVFILSYDSTPDVITDFEVGVDRLDLAGWPMVRSASQLTLEITATGFRVTYGDEVLDVRSHDGQPIEPRNLPDSDLLGGTRLPDVILPGFAGPYTRPPSLPDRVSDDGMGDPLPAVSIGGVSYRTPNIGSTNGMRYYGSNRSEVVQGGSQRDLVYARDGNDLLRGGSAADKLFGQFGRDRIYGGGGDDRLDGGRADDALFGGDDDDLIYGGSGADRIAGGDGDDLIYGGSGHDMIWAGRNNDRVLLSTGNNTVRGQDGDDRVTGGSQSDRLFGDRGNDVIAGQGGSDRIMGGAGRDKLYGGDGNDVIDGQDTSDRIDGGAGADKLYGGAGTDVITGGAGDDRIFGGNWTDNLAGGGGADRIAGGAHADALQGQSGNDILWGEHGDDRAWGGTGADTIYGGDGDDRLFGQDGDDRIAGGAGADAMGGGADNDTLTGGAGDDRLWGNDGHDDLAGGADNDRLWGGDGDDTLAGQDGDDWLAGDAGDDSLWGGDGADTFVFSAGTDVAMDFVQGQDRIAIDLDLMDVPRTGNEIAFLHGEWDGTTAMLAFAGGHRLEIHGVTDFDTLGQSIDVF